MYYAPNISRNIISGSLLNQLGYKLVFKADRCIISRSNLFIGLAYLKCNLFKQSIVCNSKTHVCNVDVRRNICDDLHYLCHLRLWRVNFDKISFISKHDLISFCSLQCHNCKICMLNNITRTLLKKLYDKKHYATFCLINWIKSKVI